MSGSGYKRKSAPCLRYVRLSPNRRHSSADVRFRASVVRLTSEIETRGRTAIERTEIGRWRGAARRLSARLENDAARGSALRVTFDGHAQSRIQFACGFFLHARQHVRIGIQGDPDLGVSEALAHDLRVDTVP